MKKIAIILVLCLFSLPVFAGTVDVDIKQGDDGKWDARMVVSTNNIYLDASTSRSYATLAAAKTWARVLYNALKDVDAEVGTSPITVKIHSQTSGDINE